MCATKSRRTILCQRVGACGGGGLYPDAFMRTQVDCCNTIIIIIGALNPTAAECFIDTRTSPKKAEPLPFLRTYTCIYTCIYIYIYMYTQYIYIYIHIYMFIWAPLST